MRLGSWAVKRQLIGSITVATVIISAPGEKRAFYARWLQAGMSGQRLAQLSMTVHQQRYHPCENDKDRWVPPMALNTTLGSGLLQAEGTPAQGHLPLAGFSQPHPAQPFREILPLIKPAMPLPPGMRGVHPFVCGEAGYSSLQVYTGVNGTNKGRVPRTPWQPETMVSLPLPLCAAKIWTQARGGVSSEAVVPCLVRL